MQINWWPLYWLLMAHNNNVVTDPASPCWWWRLAPEVMRAGGSQSRSRSRLWHPEPGPVTLSPCARLPCQAGVNKTWARLLNTNRVTLFNLQPQPQPHQHWPSASCSVWWCGWGPQTSEHLVCCPHAAPYLMIASIYLMAQIYLFNHSRTYASRKCMSCFK